MATETRLLDTADPAPLGLVAFGMTTALLNVANVHAIDVSVMILGMGIFTGGLAQFIAGLWSFRAGNTFNATAFTSYGVFWWSLVIILVAPKALGIPSDDISTGFFFLAWGIYTTFMFVGTLKVNRAVQIVFATLAILLYLLAAQNFADNAVLGVLAGIDGIICGLTAMYAAGSMVINTMFKRQVLPL